MVCLNEAKNDCYLAIKIKALAKEMGYVPNRGGKNLAAVRERYKIGVLLPSIGNAFFEGVIEGINRAIAEYEDLGVDVIINKVQGYDEATHLASIDDLKLKGCSAICLATLDTPAVSKKIEECNKIL